MKKTALNAMHREMGGKMVEFVGFDMPVQFEGINAEHETVRNRLGVFDVSHMGEFWVEGPYAFSLVQKVSTNDVATLMDGKVQYSCFPNGKGGIIGDLSDLDMSHIDVITTGELRRFVPVWENKKYMAPCQATCPSGIPVDERWGLVRATSPQGQATVQALQLVHR